MISSCNSNFVKSQLTSVLDFKPCHLDNPLEILLIYSSSLLFPFLFLLAKRPLFQRPPVSPSPEAASRLSSEGPTRKDSGILFTFPNLSVSSKSPSLPRPCLLQFRSHLSKVNLQMTPYRIITLQIPISSIRPLRLELTIIPLQFLRPNPKRNFRTSLESQAFSTPNLFKGS